MNNMILKTLAATAFTITTLVTLLAMQAQLRSNPERSSSWSRATFRKKRKQAATVSFFIRTTMATHMFSKPNKFASSVSHVWHTLAFRLTASYAAAGLLLVLLATLSLYLVLVSELNKSTELFLKDKVNVVRTMLRERPDDTDGLHEEVELESASRRYEQF